MAGPLDQMRLSSTFSDNGDVRQKNYTFISAIFRTLP
jgi:hypothetical protein